MVNLHRRYRLTTTQLAAATEDRFSDGSGSGSITMPHEEVEALDDVHAVHPGEPIGQVAGQIRAVIRIRTGEVLAASVQRMQVVLPLVEVVATSSCGIVIDPLPLPSENRSSSRRPTASW